MDLYLYGASGHGKVIAEIAEESSVKIKAFIDDDRSKTKILHYPIIHQSPNEEFNLIVAIGNNRIRKKIAHDNYSCNFPTLIHPKTTISKRASIGKGTVVMAGVSINVDAQIGEHCIINTNSSIDHDVKLENFVHISPCAALSGNIEVGEGTHIGTGASVIPGIKIGKWCTVGAGTVVIRDIPDGATVVGNPGRVIKINSL